MFIGVLIGLETDWVMHCERFDERKVERRRAHDAAVAAGTVAPDAPNPHHDSWCEQDWPFSRGAGYITQAIFTWEAIVKVLAEGNQPFNYFRDRDDGPWNCLDFFIVCIGES